MELMAEKIEGKKLTRTLNISNNLTSENMYDSFVDYVHFMRRFGIQHLNFTRW